MDGWKETMIYSKQYLDEHYSKFIKFAKKMFPFEVYVDASINRNASYVRVPWVKKW